MTRQGDTPATSGLPVDPDASPARERARLDVLAVIAIGGMLGASARYGIARAMPVEPERFPWATFLTNVSGSLVLGLLLVVLVEHGIGGRYARPFLATGVLGAYTTMSTFAVETSLLVKDGDVLLGVTYAIASVAVGLAAAVAGIRLGRAWR